MTDTSLIDLYTSNSEFVLVCGSVLYMNKNEWVDFGTMISIRMNEAVRTILVYIIFDFISKLLPFVGKLSDHI